MKRVSEVLDNASAKKSRAITDEETVENVARAVAESLEENSDTCSMSEDTLESATPNIVALPVSDETCTVDNEFGQEDDDSQTLHVIAQHMDITEPLLTLRTLLEQKLGLELSDYTFYLQDTHELDACKNLVDQCVEGEGLVQVNVEITTKDGIKKINIVDVLKPAEEIVGMSPIQQVEQIEQSNQVSKVVIPIAEEQENVTRWVVCTQFRKEQERLKMPFDPTLWSPVHVKIWVQWAIKQFGLQGVKVDSWNMTGRQLCDLTHPEFVKRVPLDKGDLFWTHLELLRKCKFVAVVQQPPSNTVTTVTLTADGKISKPFSVKSRPKSPKIGMPKIADGNVIHTPQPGNRTGNNGQIQLWQFLLELLTDKDHREDIQWLGEEGEFKLNNPEMVAQLWGQRKNKPTMNYEKLSRALRYYYDGDMIAKVHGKRFVYKFVCDLKTLLGYSAAELNRLVVECEQKKLDKVRSNFLPTKRITLTTISKGNS